MDSARVAPQPEILNFAVRCMICRRLLSGDPEARLVSHGLGGCCETSYRAANGLPPRGAQASDEGLGAPRVGTAPCSLVPARLGSAPLSRVPAGLALVSGRTEAGGRPVVLLGGAA